MLTSFQPFFIRQTITLIQVPLNEIKCATKNHMSSTKPTVRKLNVKKKQKSFKFSTFPYRIFIKVFAL